MVKDLEGTRTYERLRKLYTMGQPPAKLTVKLSTHISDSPDSDQWGNSFEETVVHVERVITYWSRTFKPAETRYSATEREALAAKEGLVKFLPIIEGEQITLITDHAALQWAKTWKDQDAVRVRVLRSNTALVPLSTDALRDLFGTHQQDFAKPTGGRNFRA